MPDITPPHAPRQADAEPIGRYCACRIRITPLVDGSTIHSERGILFYQWNDSMSVGVALIDNDHKALIHLINRLHESVSAENAYDVLDDLLSRLIDYIDIHFTREARIMDACDY